ncbi:MAG TPA: FkbM family methyltransferase [Burkholderiales bacterium]|nr:FkbM family methyltransferase [Burkholderiales bacterium]
MTSVFFGGLFESTYRASPIRLVDVGARGGLQPNWRPAQAHLHMVGFEPDPEEHQRLAGAGEANRTYLNAALYSKAGKIKLNLCKSPATSSIFPPNRALLRHFPQPDRFDVVRVVEVDADTLDAQLSASGLKDIDFLKVDVQGAELEILKGGVSTLDRYVVGVEVEVEFMPLYEGQPLFADIDPFLRDRGFELFDLRPTYWKRRPGLGGRKGQLAFADALYLKSPETLATQIEAESDVDARRAKLLKAMSIFLLYGYPDYALCLLDRCGSVLENADRVAATNFLHRSRDLCIRIPHFPGRNALHRALSKGVDIIAPVYARWAAGGFRLGNRD